MGAVEAWLRAERATLSWLDTDRYVWSVFAGRPERWYDDPAALAAATAQAQQIIGSDVHAVRLCGPFSPPPGATAAEVCAALAGPRERRLLAETLDALAHRLGPQVDLALDCPSPRTLLGAQAGFDDLDDVAASLLEVIRTVADRPVRCLQITAAGPEPDDDEIESWASLLAAAGHYGWATAIRRDGAVGANGGAGLPADLLLLPGLGPEELPDDRRHGGGLPPAVWQATPEGARLAEAAVKRGFRYGEIPADAQPEVVLSRSAALAGKAG